MPTTDRREPGRVRLVLVALVVVAVGAAGVALTRLGVGPFQEPEGCRAQVGDVKVQLSTTQAENAALVAAIAVRRGLPARAASIALAAAFQESKLRNLGGGDRDSVGLFQQRPSQGWGTRRQIMDPHYAINAFYDALTKVDGYEDLPITEAAQRVQRSGFPDAYAQHEAGARALSSALTGWSPAKFSCVVDAPSDGGAGASAAAAVPRVRADLEAAFGPLPVTRATGRSLEVAVTPVDAEHLRRGWAIAAYLVARAHRLDVDRVVFDGRVWSAGRSSQSGWQPYPSGAGSGAAQQRDRVTVEAGTPGSN